MPTARELLEQADALMRRRRDSVEPDLGRAEVTSVMRGPATDPSRAVTESPAPMARPPALPAAPEGAPPGEAASATAALSAMRWSAPAPPTSTASTSPVFAPPPTLSPRTIQREPIAPSIARTALPVEPLEPARFAPTPAIQPIALPAGEPDIPVLTDAVEAREVGALDDVPLLTEAVDALPAEVLPEGFGAPSRFADPTIGGPPSMLARGPVTVTPPSTERDPLGLDQPPPGFEPPAAARWVAPAPAAPASEPEPTALEEAVAAPPAEPVAEEAPAVAAAVAPLPAPPVLAPLDDARVREIAEEIGMQVLQRIDIFTDTELRARLGERLKPVVERASVDLVAAINQHVGELLRAYVAEAIETEINRWSDRQR